MVKLSKQAVLDGIQELAGQKELTLTEVTDAFTRGAPDQVPAVPTGPARPVAPSRIVTLTNALYVAGAVIVVAALAFTILQNWADFDATSRILVTLGLGALLTVGGWWRLHKLDKPNGDTLGATLLTIGSVATTLGAFVAADEFNGPLGPDGVTIIFLVLTAIFAGLYYFVLRSAIWLLFGIFTISLSLYSASEWAVREFLLRLPDDYYQYLTAVIGLAYMLLSRWFITRNIAHLVSSPLYYLGVVLLLTSLLWVSFTSSAERGEVFDLIYPFVVLGVMALSAYWRRPRSLIIASLFLAIFIFQVCYEYFAEELGGSISLLLAGGLVMGMGYLVATFSKRYLKR